MAVKRTKERIEFTFYWPTLHDDCREYARTCHVCQVKKRKSRRDQIPITPIQRSDRIWEHFFADCAGPFVSGEGTKPRYNYAFIAVDSFSRFPFLCHLNHCTPRPCVKLCYRFGSSLAFVLICRRIWRRILLAS